MERAFNGVLMREIYDFMRLRQHTFVWHLPAIFWGNGQHLAVALVALRMVAV